MMPGKYHFNVLIIWFGIVFQPKNKSINFRKCGCAVRHAIERLETFKQFELMLGKRTSSIRVCKMFCFSKNNPSGSLTSSDLLE